MIENRRIKCFTFIVFLIVCVEVFLNIGPSTEVFMQTGQLSKALSCPRTSFVKRRSTTHRKNWDIVALASFPGSGNTWVREMIQQGLGVWTGAVYKDPGLLHNGFIAEGQKDSSVIVVKTHYPLKGCFSKRYQEYRTCVGERDNVWKASGTLFVIRNPFDTILADFNRIASGRNHTGVAEESAFKVEKWENYVRKRAIKWNFHVGYYRHSVPSESIARVSTLPDIRSIGNLQYPPDDEQVGVSLRRNYIDGSGKPVRMIVFELLRHSFASEYQELLNALRELHHDTIEFPDVETATNCAKRPITEKFHRKSSKLLFNPFTEKQIAYLCAVTKDQWLPEVWGKCDGRLSWQRRL